MKVLLVAINSKYIHSNLAVYSLKAFHDSRSEYKDCVEIAEFTINQYTEDIIRGIYKSRPDVIAFSCYIWNISYVYEIACEMKKILPDTDIWLGGPEVTYDSEAVLSKHPYLRGIMTGEGEQTFLEVCDCYCGDRQHNLENIGQITIRTHSNAIVKTADRPLLSMDELPFIYSPQYNDMSVFKNKIIYYESSRGCPFGCSYCLSSVEKSVRFRGLSLVFLELKFFLDAGVEQVKFVDRTFNCDHDRTLKLLQFIKENDNGKTNFHFEIAADLLKADEIAIIRQMRTGLIQLEIGVQSANELTISEIDRTMNLDELSETVEKINENCNVHQHLDLIAGLPFEDFMSFQRSFNYVYALQPAQLQLGFLKVLKGSKMHLKAEEYGIVYKSVPPYEVLYTKWITYDEILKLKQVEEMVELYYNSAQYQNTIYILPEYFESPYALYARLAEYYELNGLFDLKHSRITRYTILLEFLKEYFHNQGKDCEFETISELLVYDLYLRENLKTRPQFAIELSQMKGLIRKLYHLCKADKSAHIEPFHHKSQACICNIQGSRRKDKDYVQESIMLDKCWKEQLDAVELQLFEQYTWVLFDYEHKNTIDGSATVAVLYK